MIQYTASHFSLDMGRSAIPSLWLSQSDCDGDEDNLLQCANDIWNDIHSYCLVPWRDPTAGAHCFENGEGMKES